MNVIVKESCGDWVVTLPEYPAGQCWSNHPTQPQAIAEAERVASDMGYDGVTVVDAGMSDANTLHDEFGCDPWTTPGHPAAR